MDLLIGYTNLAKGQTLSTDSASTAFPVARANNHRLDRAARSDNDLSIWVQADLGAAGDVDIVSLIATNLEADATRRVRVGDDSSFATTDYDTGVTLGAAFDTTWTNRLSWAPPHGRTMIQRVTPSANRRYVRIDLDDAGNADGFLRYGVFWAGPTYSPPDSYMSYSIDTEISDGRVRRICNLRYDSLLRADAGEFFALLAALGDRNRVLIVPQDDAPESWLNEAFLANLVDSTRLESVDMDNLERSGEVQFREVTF